MNENKPMFRLKSGKTLSLAEMKNLSSFAEEREIQIAYVESLTDQGVHVDQIPREELAEALEYFISNSLFFARDDGWGCSETALSARAIDIWHHQQAQQLVRDACKEYLQEHRQELMSRVELPSGAVVLEDEAGEASALSEAWTRQRLAAELLKEEQGGASPSREDVLRIAEKISVDCCPPQIHTLLKNALLKIFD